MHYVILGNGIAGIEAARVLRARDKDARISVVSAEHAHFFSRTALMYVLCGQLSLQDTEPYGRDFYEKMRLQRVQKQVIRLDREQKLLIFSDQSTLGYDRLLIAVGSKARPAPWKNSSGSGVHTLVTLQDLERLKPDVVAGRTALVVGGGLIGVEAAEAFHSMGMKVHFLIREPWYFPVALDPTEAEVVAAHIRGHGVQVSLQTEITEVVRSENGSLLGVQTPQGMLSASLLLTSIGVEPNTQFLTGSLPLCTQTQAIEANAYLQTQDPSIWTAGDCALVTWIDQSRRPEQLWYTARDQGRVAAANMLGDNTPYHRKSWYNSAKFFDLEYTTAGYIPTPLNQARPPQGYQIWYQQVPQTAITQRIICKDNRVVGFNCLGSRWNHTVFLRWIEEQRSLAWVLKNMPSAQHDEEFMPRFRVYSPTLRTE